MDTQYTSLDYYTTDKYKGFYKCPKPKNGFSRMLHLVFTNGKKTIYTTGVCPEDATAKAFIAIDNYHKQQKKIKSTLKIKVTSLKRVIQKRRKPKRVLAGA